MSLADLRALRRWELDELIRVHNAANSEDDDVDYDTDPDEVNKVWER